jgi:cytochrome c oxidase subunit III
MTSATATASAVTHATPTNRLVYNRLGLWLFFVSEVFMFGGMLVVRFHLWGNTRPDLDQQLGLLVTSILLLSSFFMNRAELAAKHDDRTNFLVSLVITGVLGTIFLVGVIGFEWRGHIRPNDGVYGSVLYAMTGLHALHVLSGIIFIAIVWLYGLKGRYSSQNYWGVEACAIYWHFVDVVWVFFYPALYLIGTLHHI